MSAVKCLESASTEMLAAEEQRQPRAPSLNDKSLLILNHSALGSGEESQVGKFEIPSTGSGQALHFAKNAPFRACPDEGRDDGLL
jgi:hypothetical protein